MRTVSRGARPSHCCRSNNGLWTLNAHDVVFIPCSAPCTGYVVDGFRKPPVLGGYLSHEQERGSIEGMVISSIKKVNRTLEDPSIKVALTFY